VKHPFLGSKAVVKNLQRMPGWSRGLVELYLGSCGAWDGFKPNNKSFRLVVFIFATFFKDAFFKDGVFKDGVLYHFLIAEHFGTSEHFGGGGGGE